MYLIKNVEVYTPKCIGIKDVLFSEKIELINDCIDVDLPNIKVIDATGKKLFPGFIDNHVHITGGGGEGGFKTLVQPSQLSDFTSNGITTVVGLLGTDGTSKSVEGLVAKAKALKEEGLSVYCYTGSYELPTITLTSSVRKDIMFIEEIIGVKIAISDHRSSVVTFEELTRVASDARVAGMLSGKSGSVCVHVGEEESGLKHLFDIIEKTSLPAKTFRPTHVSRNDKLLSDAFKFTKYGGYIDITAQNNACEAICKSIEAGINQSLITISSDGFGSWSKYDFDGKLTEFGVVEVSVLYETFKEFVIEKNMDIENALQYFTSNCASALAIGETKGHIKEGWDSDLLIVNADLELEYVFAQGRLHVKNKNQVIKGCYEK